MDNYFLESLGSKIKILRKSRGVSQEDLAKQSEITRTYLTQIENGKVNPSIGKIKKISENLNISLCEMFKDI
ncbi:MULTISPECIES: helix-turn-helix domain-containing protein [Acinetobacter]|uniref:C.BspHIP n=1 Tax=Bacillus sp. H(2010) TaxID=932687 RepID=E5Q8U9_9BACI|nr:helix-turn-helix transcriptional regulator [Acinetobacter sp. NEB 394]ADR73004.1 C.BspHIP [Bacillus sp. H(2010)]QKY92180.1 helix-turn-helix transcriptional regulator [Acinetobacter sp. NEB 394]